MPMITINVAPPAPPAPFAPAYSDTDIEDIAKDGFSARYTISKDVDVREVAKDVARARASSRGA